MDARSRRNAAALSLSLAAVALPVLAAGQGGMHWFVVNGRLEAMATTTQAGSGYGLRGRLSKMPASTVQSNSALVLDAKLAPTVLECTSNDIIFQNGFDTP